MQLLLDSSSIPEVIRLAISSMIFSILVDPGVSQFTEKDWKWWENGISFKTKNTLIFITKYYSQSCWKKHNCGWSWHNKRKGEKTPRLGLSSCKPHLQVGPQSVLIFKKNTATAKFGFQKFLGPKFFGPKFLLWPNIFSDLKFAGKLLLWIQLWPSSSWLIL